MPTSVMAPPLPSACVLPLRRRQEWSIGMYAGVSPTALMPVPGLSNPVLTRQEVTDANAAFVADPFMLIVDDTWYMFFEVLDPRLDRGMIGLATSSNGLEWRYQRLVLIEPFHLSYPYVFAWQSEYYMVPESYQAGAIRLYRAAPFPTTWSYVTTLVRGEYLVDPSLAYYDDRWWLFTDASPQHQHDTLRLYQAKDLYGPWHEHPCSPLVVANGHKARPAGRVVVLPEGLLRYTQNGEPLYGQGVSAFHVTVSPTTYIEQPHGQGPVLAGSGTGWNAVGMHHVDPHRLPDGRWLACVDGCRWGEAL
jgi:hypothetical protein